MRVLVADDHAILRQGLRDMLSGEAGVEVIAEESNGERALAAIRALKPDIAVVDIEMPGMSGIEIAHKVNSEHLLTSVVVLSVHKEDSFVQAALDAGVAGYILKEDAPHDLLKAVRAAAAGDMFLSPRVTGPLLKAARGTPAPQQPELTPRERDVVRLIARGLTSKEIARELALTPKTVEGYRANIMDKLSIRTVAHLVKYALKHHLTGIDD